MELASIVEQYADAFKANYAARLLPAHLQALDAIRQCRTPQAGEMQLRCTECNQRMWQPRSCGHRSCPKCQNHEASRWLDRQQTKRLPVGYFMVTFTLPNELRSLAWRHQTTVYTILFACVSSTLKDFGLNPKHLGANIGLTAILHTHTRRLDYHPHVHVVVPAGGVDMRRRQWKKKRGKYLFNAFALAKLFRGRCLAGLNAAGLSLPHKLPEKWVVNCASVGTGQSALKYLSRYLYRGVISEKAILANHDGQVTFQYTERRTGKTRYRTLQGDEFCWLVVQHALPKGFRRVRDYGFLHGNAKTLLKLVQLVLHVVINATTPRPRPVFTCPHCHAPMQIVAFSQPAWASG
jgi:putative transposase/transposase-like zinc-binding protein